MGIAAKISATECCFTKATEIQITPHQMAIAARKLGLSYGELVDKMSRGLIDREVVEKKIKEK